MSEYYKKDGVDIQRMISEQMKKGIDRNKQQSEMGHNRSDMAFTPGRIANEALKILSEGQIERDVLHAEECSPCLH